MISETESRKRVDKPLGIYLVEAGIVTPEQVKMALEEQNRSQAQRLGEVLANRGWVAQETIEYLMKKVILPERHVLEQYERESLTFHKISDYNSLQMGKLPEAEIRFDITPAKIVRLLLFVVFGLVLFNLFLQFSLRFLPDYPLRDTLIPLFNVDREQNIPALYSVLGLGFCACLLGAIAHQKALLSDRFVNHWRALTIIFAYLAVDEAVSLHELATEPIRDKFNTSGLLYYAWVVPALVLIVAFLIAFVKFLNDLPAKTKRLFLIAGTIFVSGAIGMELIGGFLEDTYGGKNYIYNICASIEELLEMLGIVVFIKALFSYITTYLKISGVEINLIDSKKQRKSA